MNSSRPKLVGNPFAVWSQIALQSGEMVLASTQVISQRSRRMALAGPLPSARDQREFARMSQEKGEAALESAQAVGVGMLMLGQQVASLGFKQMMSSSLGLMSIATSRSPVESMQRQSKLVRDTVTNTVAVASKLSGSPAQLARRALKPVHARVKGNVRRLGKNVK